MCLYFVNYTYMEFFVHFFTELTLNINLKKGIIIGILFQKYPRGREGNLKKPLESWGNLDMRSLDIRVWVCVYLHFSGLDISGSSELVFWGLSSVFFFFFTALLPGSNASEWARQKEGGVLKKEKKSSAHILVVTPKVKRTLCESFV